MTKPVEVRAPRSDELRAVARLKIEESRIDPLPDKAAEWAYADDLAAWMDRMGDRVVCRIAVVGGEVVDTAWLVVFERVPEFLDRKGRTGDVQSVYVVPTRRGHGVAQLLIAAICAEADRRGIPRLRVHASRPGVPLYEDAGFTSAETLLDRQAQPPRADAEAGIPSGTTGSPNP